MNHQECAPAKICSKCEAGKPLTDFHKRKEGYAPKCKVCVAEYTKQYNEARRVEKNRKAAIYREANREVLAQRSRDWYEKADKEKVKKRMKAYNQANRERAKELNMNWINANRDKKRAHGRKAYRNNPESYARHTALRRRMQKQAIPAWYDAEAVNDVYKRAVEVSESTGVLHHVDHIVPINNPIVCGLHVQGNLQVITAEENLKKRNYF